MIDLSTAVVAASVAGVSIGLVLMGIQHRTEAKPMANIHRTADEKLTDKESSSSHMGALPESVTPIAMPPSSGTGQPNFFDMSALKALDEQIAPYVDPTYTYTEFIRDLRALGFDRYSAHAHEIYTAECDLLDETELSEMLAYVPDNFPYYMANGRIHDADAEDLSEGSIGEFLDRLRPFLRLQGVVEFTVSEEFEDNHYSVFVDGVQHVIYTEKELTESPDELWEVSSAKAFAIVNGMLERAGSPERAYSYDDGGQGALVFLTPEMNNLFRKYPGLSRYQRPQMVSKDGRRFVYQ